MFSAWASVTAVSSCSNHRDGRECVVAYGAGVGVDLGCDGGEEAAAGKHAALEVGEERLAERAEASDPGRPVERGIDDFGVEDRVGRLDRRELQLLLRPEVGEEAALAHPDRVGESPEREAFDALDRRQSRRRAEDRLAAPDPSLRCRLGAAAFAGGCSFILDKLARPVVLFPNTTDRSC